MKYVYGRTILKAGTCTIQTIYTIWSIRRTLKMKRVITMAYHISCWRPAVRKQAKILRYHKKALTRATDDFSSSHLIVSYRSVVVDDSTSVPRVHDSVVLRLCACWVEVDDEWKRQAAGE